MPGSVDVHSQQSCNKDQSSRSWLAARSDFFQNVRFELVGLSSKPLAGTNIALGNANRQLAETRMQLAQETETERRRIARDLHDQTLADLRRLLLLTDQLPAGSGENGRQTLDPAVFRREIETISTEIRRICEDLSPSTLANVGLPAALEWALACAVAQMPPHQKFAFEFVCGENFEEHLRVETSRADSDLSNHAGGAQ